MDDALAAFLLIFASLIFLFLLMMLFPGEPSLMDALIFRLMECQ